MKKRGTKQTDTENNLAIYLKEINRIPMLSHEEEEKTARAAMAGNKAAREKLINANLRFVVSVAKKYRGFGLLLEDLISEGNAGLVTAVDRFDVEKGYRFISYAVWWIRQAIMSALFEKARMIRLPANKAAELVKIEKARKFVRDRYSPEEEIAEIAKLLNMEKKYVSDLLNISQEISSLDSPAVGREDSEVKDFIEAQYDAPDRNMELASMEAEIDKALDTLNEKESDIIRSHYGLGRRQMSLQELGVNYNLTKERVRQIKERALSRLRNPVRAERLQMYAA